MCAFMDCVFLLVLAGAAKVIIFFGQTHDQFVRDGVPVAMECLFISLNGCDMLWDGQWCALTAYIDVCVVHIRYGSC